MIQELITYTIVAAAMGHFIYGTVKLFVSKNKQTVCGNCSGACDHNHVDMIKKLQKRVVEIDR